MGAEIATPVRRTPTTVHTAADAARHRAAGHWREETVGAHVRRAAAARPDAPALVTATTRLSWAQYDAAADRLAGQLVAAGLQRGAHLAVLLPDGPTAHVAYLAAERAGLVVIGVASRSGEREVLHLLRLAEADALLTHAEPRGLPLAPLLARLRAEGLPRLRSLVVPDLAADPCGEVARRWASRRGRGGRPRPPAPPRRAVPAQLDLGHHGPAEVRRPQPAAVAARRPARDRQRRARRRRRDPLRRPDAVRLRPLVGPHRRLPCSARRPSCWSGSTSTRCST